VRQLPHEVSSGVFPCLCSDKQRPAAMTWACLRNDSKETKETRDETLQATTFRLNSPTGRPP
jgi:hypothetical protein